MIARVLAPKLDLGLFNFMKAVALDEAQSHLNKLFEDAQAGSPVLLVRGGEVAKLERVEPPEFGGDIATLEKMLLEAVEGPHTDWTPKDLDDIAQRVREKRAR
jgi:hypothetical protein